ncbi:LOW QUALITY PROTEIN: lymphocyte cytosolic protein 2a [Anoplopoma fimbria]|uniref:LOW QUALITY PROTEIN: lymphocyte cytosolic protein 2a n=1 Tax=Anoplopoma fimbria TaxID=229290 RepID=UPI0023EDED2A|nr:LOW QUALITY PROTEIN: lymphocyte cytosolic protein 2a [Anoplopoma fimbria]
MSADQVPSRTVVSGWSPQKLADYLKRMNLTGCDKVVLKNSIDGARFVNLSDNDLQKFPKLHAPMISKFSAEISKKEERRGLFGKKSTPKYHEPDTTAEVQGWGEDEFDDEDFDSDYENPCSGDDEDEGDYESPNEDLDGSNDYEPPPTEPPEDLVHKLIPSLPISDEDYIDSHVTSRGPPPTVCPRPPASNLSVSTPRMPESSSSRRDVSPNCRGGKLPPGPPQIFRGNKPGRDSGSNSSPVRGPQPNTMDKPGSHSRRPPQVDSPDPPTWSKPPVIPSSSTSVSRTNSSARPPPNRFDGRREVTPKHNTFPLPGKSLPPRPGLPGLPSHQGDSLPPSVPSAGSLPHKLQSAVRQSFRPSPPTTAHTQELDPRWYVGKVTRSQAEGCLKQVNKDGAYLVRDSTRQQPNQPFTLMVLYQDKVYNIQIRQQNQNFLLGTGLKAQEIFPSVSGMVSHYSQSYLLLIDAKNRSPGQQNQCKLSDPAGYHMSRQQWS